MVFSAVAESDFGAGALTFVVSLAAVPHTCRYQKQTNKQTNKSLFRLAVQTIDNLYSYIHETHIEQECSKACREHMITTCWLLRIN